MKADFVILLLKIQMYNIYCTGLRGLLLKQVTMHAVTLRYSPVCIIYFPLESSYLSVQVFVDLILSIHVSIYVPLYLLS